MGVDDFNGQKFIPSTVDFVPSTEIWYTDGSVVLAAEKTAFRVHGTILAAQCEIFKDMFAMPQPATPDPKSETYEGCQILRLQDSPTDLKHFLKSIYDFSYFRTGQRTKFQVVAAVLRLATKYGALELRHRAITLLATAYPSTLDDELTAYIGLAIETDVRVILPALYYSASKEPLSDILAQLQNLAVAPGIRWDVCKTFVLGRERLLLAKQAYALQFLQKDFRLPNCEDRHNDSGRLQSAARMALPKAADEEPYYRWCIENPEEVGRSLEVCKHCRATIAASIRAGERKVWWQLPKLFHFPDWDTLKTRDGLLFQDDRSPTPEPMIH